MLEQAKFTYNTLGKVLKKQRQTIEHQGRKQTDPYYIINYYIINH